MAYEKRDWRRELVLAHPDLFDPVSDPPRVEADVGDGWRDLLERLCGRMETALQPGETIRITQVVKKSASLRVYWRGDASADTVARLHEAVALAKARSACTCESCGKEGRLCILGEFSMIRCANHMEGELIPAPLGQENVHLVRVRAADGYRIVARRYDREADRFLDETPTIPDVRRPETAVTASWQADVMQAHPRLFRIPRDEPTSSPGYPRCSQGWRDLLDQLCSRIEDALGENETFEFTRIDDKLRLLLIRWIGEVSRETRVKIEEAIHLASRRAGRTCSTCGLDRSAATQA